MKCFKRNCFFRQEKKWGWNRMDTKKIRFLSHMGSRGAFGQAIYDLAQEGVDFWAISADLGEASGFRRFEEVCPQKCINIGIAEQNLVGVAAGIAKDKTPVVATTYAPFASMRCADQIRNYMGYMKLNVKVVGLDSGMIQSKFGGSHYGIEDMGLLRMIPNITVISPADGQEIYAATQAMISHEGPVYLRLTGGQRLPLIYKNTDYKFEIGKAIKLKEGNEIAFVATGTILQEALKAAESLEAEGVSCTVIDMHTIKPLDTEVLDEIAEHKLIVTVEEHSRIGGLGSAVAEYYAETAQRPRQLMVGTPDQYVHPGEYKYLWDVCGLTSEKIMECIKKVEL